VLLELQPAGDAANAFAKVAQARLQKVPVPAVQGLVGLQAQYTISAAKPQR